jgi:hypothetical protein
MKVPHASLQQSSPLDWNEALDIINNATSSEQATTTFNLGLGGASSRSCKYVLNTLMQENADGTSAFIVLIYLLWPVGSSRFAVLAKHGAVNV